MFKEKKLKTENLETIIGPGVKLEGNFVAEGEVIIKGQIKGTIETKDNLRIEDGSFVEGDSKAKNIFLAGEVKGNLKAEEKISLSRTARLLGNIECKILSIEEGAIINGECRMTEKITEE